MNSVCFCFPFPFFFPGPPTATSAGAVTSSASLALAVSSCAERPGAQADVAGGALPRMCCSWLLREETTGRARGVAELGSIGNAAFVSAGAGVGGAGGGFPPWEAVGAALLLPPPPALTLAADADHAVLRTPCLRPAGEGPAGRGCGAGDDAITCDDDCCCCGALRGEMVAPRSAACATRSQTVRCACLGGGATRCALRTRPLAIDA